MNVPPAATFEAVIEVGETGLVGTVGVEVNDNLGAVSVPFSTSGITEIAPGVYSASGLVAPTVAGQYTLLWRRGAGGEVLGIDDLLVTSSAVPPVPISDAYVDVNELFRVVRIRTPTPAQIAAAERVIVTSAGEINSEISRTDGTLPDWGYQLCAFVNLKRAVEHWQQEEAPMGITGLTGENLRLVQTEPLDTWPTYQAILAPLKEGWGLS